MSTVTRALRIVIAVLRRLPRLPRFAAFFAWQLLSANVRVAREVLTPGFTMSAGIIRVPTRCRSDLEVTLLANAITLTPGTMSLEIEPATRAIHVHGLYVEDRATFLAGLARFEDEILRVVR
jgi:multicomponent Na+:H+ antiporter subunit E